MPRPSPFLLHGWVSEWWRHFGERERLAVVAPRSGGRLVGVAPFYVDAWARPAGGTLPRRHESALADLMLADGPARRRAGLLDELRRSPSTSPTSSVCPPARSRRRCRTGADRAGRGPRLAMPDGWEAAYAAKTSSRNATCIAGVSVSSASSAASSSRSPQPGGARPLLDEPSRCTISAGGRRTADLRHRGGRASTGRRCNGSPATACCASC